MIPVVLSGGVGTRLWPLSRANFPKQFCELLDESLLLKTLKRISEFGSPWTVTVGEVKHLTDRVYHDLNIPTEQILIEPMGRNTAPAVALLLHKMRQESKENEIVGVFPADHLILKTDVFNEAIQVAQACAEKGQVVTLGLKPHYPATGFGYIEVTNDVFAEGKLDIKAHPTKGFREKPNKATAQEFLEQGRFYWNAGMFFFKVSKMIEHFQEHLPELWKQVESIKADFSNVGEVYGELESISIDHGIMEKISDQVCIPCDLGWSDLGSWDDVSELSETSPMGLANKATELSIDSSNNFSFSPSKKIVGLVGVEDLIIVDMPDALMVAKKGQTQKVKQLVEKIRELEMKEAHEHIFDVRPWGKYAVLYDHGAFKAKYITVDPGHQLSYQRHKERAEHWVIVQGQGRVTLDDQIHDLDKGQSVTIGKGVKHRIKNTGDEPLIFVEVQTGTYFGEDDIERFEDDYGRG